MGHFLNAKPYETGRPLGDLPELRKLVIDFGDSGYVALYRCERGTNTVYLLAFRHQKEAGYQKSPLMILPLSLSIS